MIHTLVLGSRTNKSSRVWRSLLIVMLTKPLGMLQGQKRPLQSNPYGITI